jgi:hypothetical protein
VFDSRESADASQAGDLGCPLAGGLWSLGGRLDIRGDGPSRARGVSSLEEHIVGRCTRILCRIVSPRGLVIQQRRLVIVNKVSLLVTAPDIQALK